jgi:hypothetical protein
MHGASSIQNKQPRVYLQSSLILRYIHQNLQILLLYSMQSRTVQIVNKSLCRIFELVCITSVTYLTVKARV